MIAKWPGKNKGGQFNRCTDRGEGAKIINHIINSS